MASAYSEAVFIPAVPRPGEKDTPSHTRQDWLGEIGTQPCTLALRFRYLKGHDDSITHHLMVALFFVIEAVVRKVCGARAIPVTGAGPPTLHANRLITSS